MVIAAVRGPIKIRGGVNSRDVDRLVNKLLALPLGARKEVNKALKQSAILVRNHAVTSIRDVSPTSGSRTRYKPRRTVHPATAGFPPNWDEGILGGNIKAVALPAQLAYLVESRAKYSRPLEFGFNDKKGTRHGPWPFLFPALEKNRVKIRRMIAAGIKRAFLRAARKR